MAEFMAIEVGEYIEQGLGMVANPTKAGFRVLESPLSLLDLIGRTYRASALGLALVGKFGDSQAALDEWRKVSNSSPAGQFEAAAGLLGIPVALARLVELNHRHGVPACEIAACLRSGTLGLSFRGTPAPELPEEFPDTAVSSVGTSFSLSTCR